MALAVHFGDDVDSVIYSPESEKRELYRGAFVPVKGIVSHLTGSLAGRTLVENCIGEKRSVDLHFIDGVVLNFESRYSGSRTGEEHSVLYDTLSCTAIGERDKLSRIESMIKEYIASFQQPVAK